MTTKTEERLRVRITHLEIALREISLGKGAFDRDSHEHATNTIENMKQLAIQALENPDA